MIVGKATRGRGDYLGKDLAFCVIPVTVIYIPSLTKMGATNLDAVQKLQQLSAENNCVTAVLFKRVSDLELAHQAAITHREEAHEAVVAVAVLKYLTRNFDTQCYTPSTRSPLGHQGRIQRSLRGNPFSYKINGCRAREGLSGPLSSAHPVEIATLQKPT